jgi:hypothetical protein
MKPGQLREHLVRLRQETEARQQRLSNLQAKFGGEEAPEEKQQHITRVSMEINRLEALIAEGWRLYEEREHSK